MSSVMISAPLSNKQDDMNNNGILSTDILTGLSSMEANIRLSLYGPNTLPSEPPKSLLESLLDQFKDHLVQILLLSAFISFLLALSDYYYHGNSNTPSMSVFVEPFVILVILVMNAIVGVMQESQAEQAINVYILKYDCVGIERICS